MKGSISQIIGPVVDVAFPKHVGDDFRLPGIYHALEVERPDGRVVVLKAADIEIIPYEQWPWILRTGLSRGLKYARRTVPLPCRLAPHVKGRLMNVIGDHRRFDLLDKSGSSPIQSVLSLKTYHIEEVLFTGIKVIDLLSLI